MFKNKYVLSCLAALVLAGLSWAAFCMENLPADRPHFQQSNLTITRADGMAFSFNVEIAATPAEQSYGLMFIKSLAADKGMIFPYNPPQNTAFWMKNTLIPLDMLFISPNGTIGRIVAQAKPQDLTPIPSEIPVIAVIELKGGQAKQDGLSVGDKVESPTLTY